MGAQVLPQSAAYHGPPNIETRRPLKECLAVRGSRRMTGTSTPRAPSASECATDILVRELPASGSSNSGRGSGDGSLQQVSGIGPRSEQRFISAGITSLPGLLNMFFEGKDGDEGRMRSFIQEEVGIRNGHLCSKIVSHLASMEGHGTQHHRRARHRVTLCVEGNISAGKTTFLQELLKDSVELCGEVEVVPEPVNEWQHIQSSNGREPSNLLEAFYKDPSRFAYTFQNYVFLTRLMQARRSEGCTAPLRLLERSVFSDRMVFVRAVHEAKWLSEMELAIYDSWFDPMVSSLSGLIPDGFIYLAASPETCMRRMTSRGRGEEGGVSLDYLGSLHSKHEEWLHTGNLRSEYLELLSNPSRYMDKAYPGSSKDKVGLNQCLLPEEPESLRGKIFYLSLDKQPLLQRHIDGLPALYVDCNEDIDMQRDQAAKNALAKQIKEFSNHVRNMHTARRSATSFAPPGTPNRLVPVPDVDPELLDLGHLTYTRRDMLADLNQSEQFAYL
ncbi:hypothetical protein CVIRNUC_007215 [Coccomyxa viridis]|uniref:Deoxynucleoside kinase domain-containing protein n=1 Tax=Coccomyxa viridis TaxID=1274662 RepID=A0AAV1IBD5_9CHLO|nr:hypothetical protein CVIRNUC_007215 [Coccomyxa viridis]